MSIQTRFLQILGDAVLLAIALLLAFGLRFGFILPPQYLRFVAIAIGPIIIFKILILYYAGTYERLWRYASVGTLHALIKATSISSLSIIFFLYFFQTLALPRSVFAIDWLLSIMLLGGVRFVNRSLSELRLYATMPTYSKQILIAGAGDAGEMLVREMLKNRSLGQLPIGFVDDDLRKQGMRIHGIKVFGTTKQLSKILTSRKVDEVLIAMPSASKEVKREIAFQCEQAKVKCRTLPGVYEILEGRVTLSQVRDVEVEDILGREAVEVDLDEIFGYLSGERALVTGAGGSIGSELSRQICALNPLMLIILDDAENSLFEIEQELTTAYPKIPLMAVVADIRDEAKMDDVLQAYHPAVIFHSAAYKHVPMMERNPRAALENNFIGTQVVAEAARRHRVKKFVLISTDKAVNPRNVMGVSKALAEMVLLSMSDGGETKFITVRFGNVLASRGSVVPIFKEQIARGGPVTVTHPEMRRYFMTISEAVQLVIQAGTLGQGGEIFVLNMGEQIKIVDLAENMIRLLGFEPGKDIPIEYIGIRPGEKMGEELFAANEKRLPTKHEKIFIARNENIDKKKLALELHELEKLIKEEKMRQAFEKIKMLIPAYSYQ